MGTHSRHLDDDVVQVPLVRFSRYRQLRLFRLSTRNVEFLVSEEYEQRSFTSYNLNNSSGDLKRTPDPHEIVRGLGQVVFLVEQRLHSTLCTTSLAFHGLQRRLSPRNVLEFASEISCLDLLHGKLTLKKQDLQQHGQQPQLLLEYEKILRDE